MLATSGRAHCQFLAEAQAQTPEEFDAYLDVLEKATPKEQIAAGLAFTQNWPHSGLSAHVYELEMEAYRALNEPSLAIQAGESALQGAPDNLAVLAQLAYILADSSSDPQQLAHAEVLAQKELKTAKTIQLPRTISPSQWELLQARLGSTAYSALGLVAFKRGNLTDAIREFENALSNSPDPDPAIHYRLGSLYKASGSKEQAIRELKLALDSKDPIVRSRAKDELKSLQPRDPGIAIH